MKKTSLFLFIAALVGICPLHAKTARLASKVEVYLNHKEIKGTQTLTPLGTVSGNYFGKASPLSSLGYNDTRWFCYNVPICIFGAQYEKGKVESASGKAEPATVIQELKVKVSLLYSRRAKDPAASDKSKSKSKKDSKKAEFYLLEKEITYVDIPLEHSKTDRDKKGNEFGRAEMNIGLFIPEAVVSLMLGDDEVRKAASGNDLVIEGIAIYPTFNGERISGKPTVNSFSGISKDPYSYLSSTTRNKVAENWVSPSEISKYSSIPGTRLYCISETPYAPFYGSMYPATKPLYGEPKSGTTDSQPKNDAGLPMPGDVTGTDDTSSTTTTPSSTKSSTTSGLLD